MLIELEYILNNNGSEFLFDHEFDLSGYQTGSFKPFAGLATVTGRVFNSTGIVRIKAKAAAQLQTTCDRCACDVSRILEVPVEHILVTSLNDEDNDDFILLDKPQLDLDLLAGEDIFLALPSKILCSGKCKGLCQRCGKNLNNGQCGCKKTTDPRLAVLERLLDNE